MAIDRAQEAREEREQRRLSDEYRRLGEYGMALVLLHRLERKRAMLLNSERTLRSSGSSPRVLNPITREWVRLDKAVQLAASLLDQLSTYKETDGLAMMLDIRGARTE